MTDIGDLEAPEVCTLPTAERPLRLAEFDDLFSTGLIAQTRLSPDALRWSLDLAVEGRARDLAVREAQCCSFFRFRFGADADNLWLDVEVPPEHGEVLDALAQRAAAALGTT
jgi:hypothetical protein